MKDFQDKRRQSSPAAKKKDSSHRHKEGDLGCVGKKRKKNIELGKFV